MGSFSRGQLNGTTISSSSTFSFGSTTLRQTKDAQMVVLDDDGLSLVRSTEQMHSNTAIPLFAKGASHHCCPTEHISYAQIGLLHRKQLQSFL